MITVLIKFVVLLCWLCLAVSVLCVSTSNTKDFQSVGMKNCSNDTKYEDMAVLDNTALYFVFFIPCSLA